MLERSDRDDVSDRPFAGTKSQKRLAASECGRRAHDRMRCRRIAEHHAKVLLGGGGIHEVCEGWGVPQERVVSLLASETR